MPQNQIKLYHIPTGYYQANLVWTTGLIYELYNTALIYNRTKGEVYNNFPVLQSGNKITLCLSCISGNHTDSNRVERYIGKNTQTNVRENARDGLSGNQTGSCVDKQETQLSYEIENRIIAGYLGNTVKLTQFARGILLSIDK